MAGADTLTARLRARGTRLRGELRVFALSYTAGLSFFLTYLS